MEEYFLGIDIGTGSAKAVAYSIRFSPLEMAYKNYELKTNSLGYAEQDPEIIWIAVLDCIQQIILKSGPKIRGIGLSSAMHSLMVVNDIGIPLSPLIIWADRRSEDYAEALRKSEIGESLYRETGTPIHSMSPLTKLMWMAEHQPDYLGIGHLFLSIKSFIWFKLFGVFEEDWSLASASGLMNIHEKKWSGLALGLAGIQSRQLPKLVSTTWTRKGTISKLALAIGILPEIPITIGASDGCCSHLAGFPIHLGGASLTIGTSAAIRIHSPNPIFNYMGMIFNYILDENHWVIGGPVNNGGIILNWAIEEFFKQEIQEKANYEAFFKTISNINPGSEGLIFLPYLTGERSPIWDERSSGVFFGLKIHHHKEHMMRAVLEGICFGINEVKKILVENGFMISQIQVSGGFTESPIWVQILTDILESTLIQKQDLDSSTYGAALLSMKACGFIKSFEDIPNLEILRTFHPNPENQPIYHKMNQIFNQLYPRLSDLMHQISGLG